MSKTIENVITLLLTIEDNDVNLTSPSRLHIFCWFLWTCDGGLFMPINFFLKTPKKKVIF